MKHHMYDLTIGKPKTSLSLWGRTTHGPSKQDIAERLFGLSVAMLLKDQSSAR